MFEVKHVNSLEDISKMRKQVYIAQFLFSIICAFSFILGVLGLVLGGSFVWYVCLFLFGIVAYMFLIRCDIQIRFWDLKYYLIENSKGDKNENGN